MTPAERFFKRATGAAEVEPEVASWIGAAFARCAQRFPAFSRHLEDFAEELGGRFEDRAADLPCHAVEELFVAWAAARGVPPAVASLERDYLVPACAAVKSTDPAELTQTVRVRLLVGDAERPPRIAQYSGRGPLLAWVRMTATRVAIDLARRRGAEQRVSEELAHASTPFDPELDYLKSRYAEPFRRALEQALSALSERDATLIKLAYLEDVAPSAMARIHGVSTRTVQRWIEGAREAVLDGARRILGETLNLDPAELDGLMRLARSQLNVTLERVLGPRSG